MISLKKNNRVSICKKIWFKIRYWQNIKDISDNELAAFMGVCDKTLRSYDKHYDNITLNKIDRFLAVNNMELDDLLNL